jgi:hypothetical protein
MNHRSLISTALLTALAFGQTLGCASQAGHAGRPGSQPGESAGRGANPDVTTAGASLPRADHQIANLLGGSLGAGGGFLMGVRRDKIEQDPAQARADAVKASQRAEKNPAKPDQVDKAATADLNEDGFVTIDEVVAMRQANLNDQQMLQRLQQTGEIFELTEYQQDYLRTRGVSDQLIHQIAALNQAAARTASDVDQATNGDAPGASRS